MVDAQNNTIAVLTQRIETMASSTPGFRRLQSLEKKADALRTLVADLASSLGGMVQSSLDARFVGHFEKCFNDHSEKLRDSLRPHVQEVSKGSCNQKKAKHVRFLEGKECRVSAVPSSFSKGDKVVLVGLSRLDLNGKAGVVLDASLASADRIPVGFIGTNDQALFKPDNLIHASSSPSGGASASTCSAASRSTPESS